MSTDPWERTCKRCGRNFEVGLWCREVAYCDICKAELDAMPAESLDDSLRKHQDWPEGDTPGQPVKLRGQTYTFYRIALI